MDGLWQGAYDSYIEIIGDKTSGFGAIPFVRDKTMFRSSYTILEAQLNISIHAIQAVRNPYDVIATEVIKQTRGNKYLRDLKSKFQQTMSFRKFNVSRKIEEEIQVVFKMYTSGQNVKDIMGKESVLDVHNADLVSDPRGTIFRIFKFLGVETTEHYLDVCAQKVFRSESQSRHLVQWTPKLLQLVETQMRKFEVLNRYNFTSP